MLALPTSKITLILKRNPISPRMYSPVTHKEKKILVYKSHYESANNYKAVRGRKFALANPGLYCIFTDSQCYDIAH